MNRTLHLLTEVKHLGGGMRLFLCSLLILSAMLSAAPLAGFGRASNLPVPTEEHEEQHSTFGVEARAPRHVIERPFQLVRKGRIRRLNASNALVCSGSRQGHRLPNGLMAPLRC